MEVIIGKGLSYLHLIHLLFLTANSDYKLIPLVKLVYFNFLFIKSRVKDLVQNNTNDRLHIEVFRFAIEERRNVLRFWGALL